MAADNKEVKPDQQKQGEVFDNTQESQPAQRPPVAPDTPGDQKPQVKTAGNEPPKSQQKSPTPNQQANSDQEQVVAPPPPKRSGAFGKILIVVLGLLILVGGGFAVYQFRDRLPFISGLFSGSGGNQSSSGEIVWWGLWEDDQIVQPLIEQYEQQNPGVTIRYEFQSKQDYRERLESALARGEGPDIFRFHNSWTPMLRSRLDTLPSSVMSAGEFSERFYPVIVSDTTTGSGITGIPLGFDTLVLYINEDIFNQYGVSAPETWSDLRDIAQEVTVRDENNLIRQAGVSMGLTSNVDHWPEILGLLMIQNGVDLNKPTGVPAQDALVFYNLFSSADRVWDDTLPNSTLAFASGNLAMYFGPSWRAFEIEQINPDLNYTTVPVPQLPKDDPSDPDIAYATYWIEGVNKESQVSQQAWEFLKYMSEQEQLQRFYEEAAKVRLFGEPYPRSDMAELLSDTPVAGAVVAQAPSARSWYLASRTYDGETGINSQINKYFEDALNSTTNAQSASRALDTAAQGIRQVLERYGLTSSAY